MEPSDIFWSSDQESLSESLNDTSDESIEEEIIDPHEQRNPKCFQVDSIKPPSDDNNDW